MATIRANVAQLYTPIYDEFMLAAFKEEIQVNAQIYQQIDDKTKEHKFDDLGGTGLWESATEGLGGGVEDPVLGYPRTLTQAKFWKKIQVSFEALDQDEYALLKQTGVAKQIGIGGRAKVEKDSANLLSDGFAATNADGQFLWDTDHPKNSLETGTTYSNLLAGAFSHDNLEAAETQIATNFMSMDGLPILPSEDPVLLYPPALRGAVKRVLSERALEQPDTTMRNINRFAGNYRPIEWRYLMSGMGGSQTGWFIIYPELEYLKMVWSARPSFTSWVDEDLEYYIWKGRMLYALDAVNWRCGFASTGV